MHRTGDSLYQILCPSRMEDSAQSRLPLWQIHHLPALLRFCVSSVLFFWPFVWLQCLPLVYHLPWQMAYTRSWKICPGLRTPSHNLSWCTLTFRDREILNGVKDVGKGRARKGEIKEQQLKDNYLLRRGHIYQACSAVRVWGFPAV